MSRTEFAADFPAPTYAQWSALAKRAGANFECESRDGIRIQPLYRKAIDAPGLLLGDGGWAVTQRADHPDPVSANALALADLRHGADGLVLVGAEAGAARGHGLLSFGADILNRLLEGVFVDLIALRLDAGAAAPQAANALRDHVLGQGVELDRMNIDFGIDPVGAAARVDGGTVDIAALRTAAELARSWNGSRAFLADGRPYHETGAAPAQELASVIATALFYLRGLEKEGFEPDKARCSLSFLLAADTDVFLTLSKFRALRFLWARIEEACGFDPMPVRLHAETAWRMLATCDPQLNIVRNTMAVFAAGLGGADTITVLPHTLAGELPDASARRIARNVPIILRTEAGLDWVADPAAGSGAFEALTQALCAEAWDMFVMIEASGGMPEALRTGLIRRRISDARERRETQLRPLPSYGGAVFDEELTKI